MYKRVLTLVLLVSLSLQSYASVEHKALAVMKDTAQEMQTYLKNNLRENTGAVEKKIMFKHIVLHIFLPKIAVRKMVQDIVGPKYWSKATEQQKMALIVNFRDMIVKNYSEIVEHYKGHKIYFRKLKQGAKEQLQ